MPKLHTTTSHSELHQQLNYLDKCLYDTYAPKFLITNGALRATEFYPEELLGQLLHHLMHLQQTLLLYLNR